MGQRITGTGPYIRITVGGLMRDRSREQTMRDAEDQHAVVCTDSPDENTLSGVVQNCDGTELAP